MKTPLFIAFLLCGFIGISQTTVNGTVVDQNNEPIPGANVVIVGKAIGTTADFDGLFKLETEEVPPFQLKITSIGYSEATENVTENNQTFTIVLNEAQTFLDEVVISASRTPERIFESPVSVERFGLKEIKNTTASSFYGGLENLKGVDVNTNSLTFQSLNTRGFASFANTRFMQLVDGMDNSAPGLNFVMGNLVGMSELEVQSVEILPGASSALYGAGAFNGILFMRSKNPFDYQGISAYVKGGVTTQEVAGTNEYYDVGIRVAHAFSDKFAVKANLSILKGEDWHAANKTDLADPTRTRQDHDYDGLNVYGDEVGTVLNFDTPLNLAPGTLGSAFVTRTGYDEVDLANYKAESVKFDGSIHYKPITDSDFEIIYNARVGRGNTLYQGANRYSLKNFILQQHKIEVRNKNFFVRGYITAERSGDSYDTRFAAININRSWKRDAPNPNDPSERSWFGDYVGAYIAAKLSPGPGNFASDQAAHAAARVVADEGRLIPGTPGYQAAFDKVTADGDLNTGAKFIDRSGLRHVDANYNFSHLTNAFSDIQIGGSFREYVLNSAGTIFTDIDGPITYGEYGAYLQIQKKLIDERLKLTGSVRYDKNEFFDGFFSPRFSAVYTAGEKRNQNFRASVQQGFRNPTTQDLFIGLDAGRAILVGSAPQNLDRDIRTFGLSTTGAALVGQPTATVVGRAAYENAYSLSSVSAGAPTAVNTGIVKPEEITAFEVGYRAQFGKLAIDLSGYYNQYTDFIANVTTLVPFYGQAGDGALSLLALQNGDFKAYQTYTNSEADIESYGVILGVDSKIFGNFDIGASYTYADFGFNEEAYPDFRTQFNTPKHKVKASFGNTELFKNVGFNVNYRWSDEYEWQNTFADGPIPSFSVLDAQINYTCDSLKSVFKLGGSNLLGEEYFSAVGTGLIGSMYYLSWTINP